MDETTGKLKETEELLSTAGAALEEHQVVLKEHEDTEATFHGQADKVLGTLSGTISDVNGLHAKIGIDRDTPFTHVCRETRQVAC